MRVSTTANTQREESHPRAGSQSEVRVNRKLSLIQNLRSLSCTHSVRTGSFPYLLLTVRVDFKCCRMR
ncbi:hypothetical protein cypCar_00045627, partial [Cyprinus carpio]